MRDDVEQLAEHLLHLMNIRQLTLITAESCTAGALSQRLADAPGAGPPEGARERKCADPFPA